MMDHANEPRNTLENPLWFLQTRLGQNNIGSARAQLFTNASLDCFAFAVLHEASCNQLRLYPAAVPTASRISPGNNLSTKKNRSKGLPLVGCGTRLQDAQAAGISSRVPVAQGL